MVDTKVTLRTEPAAFDIGSDRYEKLLAEYKAIMANPNPTARDMVILNYLLDYILESDQY